MSLYPTVTLPSDQYRAYDLAGGLIAERRTRAHGLDGGLEIILRDGDQYTDGICVSVEITDEQLEGLGYVRAEDAELRALMDDDEATYAPLAVPTLMDELGVGPEVFAKAAELAGLVLDHSECPVDCTASEQILEQLMDAAIIVDACGGESCCETCGAGGCCANFAKK